jgi:hypothetical protein
MKIFFISMLSLLLSVGTFAQDTTQVSNSDVETAGKFNKSKLYYGGYMSLSFGSYTVIGISPLVGYKFTPKLSSGVQLTYEYSSYDIGNDSYSSSNYGGSVFARYRLVPQIYIHTEFSTINYEVYRYVESDRKWVPFLFVGGGFSQPVTKNTWLTAQVLFDVLQNDNSPYNDWEPFFSVGVGVGF